MHPSGGNPSLSFSSGSHLGIKFDLFGARPLSMKIQAATRVPVTFAILCKVRAEASVCTDGRMYNDVWEVPGTW